MVVGILVYYNMSLNSDIDALNTQIKNTKSMLAQVEKQARQVDEIKKAFDRLKQKVFTWFPEADFPFLLIR